MKLNYFVLSVVLFGLTLQGYSQVNFGVKGGLNVAGTNNIGPDNTSYRLAYTVGLFSTINVGKQFFIRPEFAFSVKGNKFPATIASGSGVLDLGYLVIPVLAGYSFTEKFAFYGGPEFGYLIQANSKFDGSNHNVSGNFQKFDLAVDAGLSYELSTRLGAEIRYSHGFEMLAKGIKYDNMGNEIGNGRKVGSNRVFQVGVYYTFSKN